MNQRRLRRFLPGILIGMALSSVAQTPPPAAPFGVANVQATLKRIPSTGLQMGKLQVQFEKTALDDVRRAASAGEIAHQGDAGESIYWLCYTNLNMRQVERIWVISDGEMGGARHYVTGVSAESVTNGSATADCPTLPNDLKPLFLDKHLWLGASSEATTSMLGRFSFQEGAWRSYRFEGKVSGNCAGGGFDLSAWLMLHFQNDRINSLRAGQLSSC